MTEIHKVFVRICIVTSHYTNPWFLQDLRIFKLRKEKYYPTVQLTDKPYIVKYTILRKDVKIYKLYQMSVQLDSKLDTINIMM